MCTACKPEGLWGSPFLCGNGAVLWAVTQKINCLLDVCNAERRREGVPGPRAWQAAAPWRDGKHPAEISPVTSWGDLWIKDSGSNFH